MAQASEAWRLAILLRHSSRAALNGGSALGDGRGLAVAAVAASHAATTLTPRRPSGCAPPPAAAALPPRRAFFSGATSSSSGGGSSSNGGGGGVTAAAASVGNAISAALGFGGGGAAETAKALSAGVGGDSGWAARMRFRRQEPTFEVIECYPNGVARESQAPRTASQLELHPRDVVLFAPISRLAAPQRATIAVRGDKILFKTEVAQAIISADKAVLIKGRRKRDAAHLAAEIIKAAAATPASPDAAASGGQPTPCQDQQQQQQQRLDAAGGSGWPGVGGGAAPASLPFELRVLEVLLDATVEYFYTKTQHLNWMMESIGDEIKQPRRPFNATDKAHQLIPIQKFLTSIKADVKETCEALNAMINDEEHLRELCLTWQQQMGRAAMWGRGVGPSMTYSPCPQTGELKPAPTASLLNEVYEATHPPGTAPVHAGAGAGRGSGSSGGARGGGGDGAAAVGHSLSSAYLRMVSDMLESYEREIRSLEGSLAEAEENLDNTREVWHMQLDSSRNHIIMVNLWLSMINISVMATTILPAFFGMNLASGLPDESTDHFYYVVAASVFIAAMSFPVGRWWYFRHWRQMTQQELFEQKMLRVLLVQHVDDLDEVLAALARCDGPISRRRFREVVNAALGPRALTPANVNFLFDIFDTNRSGFLNEAELMRHMGRNPIAAAASATRNAAAGLEGGAAAGPPAAVVGSDGVLEGGEAVADEEAADPDQWQDDEKYRWPETDEM